MAPSARIKLDLPDEVRRFTNAEMQAATRQMSKSLMLGMGGFGPVFRLVDKEEGKCAKVGISIASKKDSGVGQGREEFANEAKLLYLWQHDRIVSLMGVCEGPVPCIIYEHMARGSLQALMSDDQGAAGFAAAKRLQASLDVANALDYLHTGGLGPNPRNPRIAHAVVLHRDLNPSNILLDGEYRAKVGDFGLSAMLHEKDVQPDVVYSCEQVVGQWAWSAPEAQTAGNMPASDVFALGLIILQLIFGCEDASACRQAFIRREVEGVFPDRRLAADSEWQETSVEPLVELCLQATREDPATRPSAKDCHEMLSRIFEMTTGEQPAPSPLVEKPKCTVERQVPMSLADRAAVTAAAGGGDGARAPGCLLRIGNHQMGVDQRGAWGGQEAVASVIAVACCDEGIAREVLEMCQGDVNQAVDVLISGRLDEVRQRASKEAQRSAGVGQPHGSDSRRQPQGSEPGKVYLPSGIGTGSGTVNFTDGSKYEGNWIDGECNGYGTYTNALGLYKGDFRNGLMHGKGYHAWRERGLEYEGEWCKGQMHGKGVLTRNGPPKQRFEIVSKYGALLTQRHIKEIGAGWARTICGARIEPNEEEQEFMKESFVAVAACSGQEALAALQDTGWDLQAAIKAFLSGDPGRILFDGLPVAASGGETGQKHRVQDQHQSAAAAHRVSSGLAATPEAGLRRGAYHQVSHSSARPAGGSILESIQISANEDVSTAADAAQETSAVAATLGPKTSVSPPEAPVPAGWERRWDASSSRFYYANQVNKTTQWEPPTEPASPSPAQLLARSEPVPASLQQPLRKGESAGTLQVPPANPMTAEPRDESSVWGGGSQPDSLQDLLERLSLGGLARVLSEQEIRDIETVSELQESDFSDMGVSVADAKILMAATMALRT